MHVTARAPERLASLARAGAVVHALDLAGAPGSLQELAARLPPGLRVLHSVPVLEQAGAPVEATARLVEALRGRVERWLYLSTTSVYGEARLVDERTPAAPAGARAALRVAAEDAVVAAGPPALVLRPAAIYGPGRGVHVAIREGRHRLAGDGSNVISRIHVEDLAALAVAGLRSEAGGRWPVGDDEPSAAGEIAAFAAGLLGVPAPVPGGSGPSARSLLVDRRVDGRAIRERLGVTLVFPSYRVGIPACLAEEAGS